MVFNVRVYSSRRTETTVGLHYESRSFRDVENSETNRPILVWSRVLSYPLVDSQYSDQTLYDYKKTFVVNKTLRLKGWRQRKGERRFNSRESYVTSGSNRSVLTKRNGLRHLHGFLGHHSWQREEKETQRVSRKCTYRMIGKRSTFGHNFIQNKIVSVSEPRKTVLKLITQKLIN